jgi:5-formyltetrahydrofolate cyclo-ligase
MSGKMTRSAADHAKHAVRERVWASLDEARAAFQPTTWGRIPDFHGKEQAARRLAQLPAWQAAAVVKANPDKAQHPVRAAALGGGKLLYMAVPRLATPKPFYLLDPARLAVLADQAATSDGAARHAGTVVVADMRPVDLIVCGTVAVSPSGARVGKGGGFSDIEVALLTEAGLISPATVIVTTVHDLQVLDEDLPETEHDFSVDVIVTPTRVIACGPPRRPCGLYWDHLEPGKISAIPALKNHAALVGKAAHQRAGG